MSVSLLPAGVAQDLAYEQTVPRGLVHRWSLSEVFLTDYRAVDDRGFVCAAQLPSSHAYYRDHPNLPGEHDTLNVLEACRQAVTYAAHVHQGIPRDTTFMVSAWLLEVTDPDALVGTQRPGNLQIAGVVTDRRARGGQVRRVAFAMDLTLDGRELGRLTMDVNCTPTGQYHNLRRLQRGREVPTAFSLPAAAAGAPVPPGRVGRFDPGNVVLDAVGPAEDGITAILSPRTFGNRSMYDHPYDHVPAMVLSEAARQCALLLCGNHFRLLRVDGRFQRFAELDAPVIVTAERNAEDGRVRMSARQGDVVVAEIDVVVG